MEKIIKYSSVETITYKFSKHEILEALQKKFNIKITNDYKFDLYEEYHSEDGEENRPDYAELIVNYKKTEPESKSS